MADVGIFTKNAGIQAKAGAGASAISKAVAWTDVLVTGVESYICVLTKTCWDAATYTAADANTKYLLADLGENLMAIYVINYDFSGYPDRSTAEDMIAVLYRQAWNDIWLLRDQDYVNFLKVGD